MLFFGNRSPKVFIAGKRLTNRVRGRGQGTARLWEGCMSVVHKRAQEEHKKAHKSASGCERAQGHVRCCYSATRLPISVNKFVERKFMVGTSQKSQNKEIALHACLLCWSR